MAWIDRAIRVRRVTSEIGIEQEDFPQDIGFC
jgi:hypothetical protein